MVRAMWQGLLPGAVLGDDEGFFDAGGNSLLLVRLHEKLENAWPGTFTVAQLFALNTISAQIQYHFKNLPDFIKVLRL